MTEIPPRKGAVGTDKELRRILDECVPKMVQVELVRGLAVAYREVYEHSREYPPKLDRDAMGQLRRIKFDTIMKAVAERHGLKAEVAQNDADNSSHVRIRAGRLILTASCVPSPKTMVRDAQFRKTYARDPQMTLDHPDFQRDEPDPDSSVYAILLHGIKRDPKKKRVQTPEIQEAEQSRPGFAWIAFPNQPMTKYVDSVDVMTRFWNTINRGGDGIDAEDIAKEFGLTVRTDKKGRKREQE